MSIVGPRPERPEIAAEYEKEMPEFRLRLQARAGLTGYAQVYGKYNGRKRKPIGKCFDVPFATCGTSVRSLQYGGCLCHILYTWNGWKRYAKGSDDYYILAKQNPKIEFIVVGSVTNEMFHIHDFNI